MTAAHRFARECGDALGLEPRSWDGLELSERGDWLGGPLPVDALAEASIGAMLLAASQLADARFGGQPIPSLSGEHASLCFQSERHARLGEAPLGAGFAPLSRFVRCGDGWVRTHANYPHHESALRTALGIAADAQDPGAALDAAASSMAAVDVEEAIVAAGGAAAAVRSPAAWAAHPAGAAADRAPLVAWGEPIDGGGVGAPGAPTVPAAGLRVLDLTRVIAGPVAGRTLAALGADVLRIDPPARPELPVQHLETGAGKRSAIADLAGADTRERLLAGADVLLTGYRGGALDRFGLDHDSLAERHPHLVTVSLTAWGVTGPWSARRGFDSLVQAASGIASITAAADGTPGALPAQALDHAAGYLMAGAGLRALTDRVLGRPHRPARLSLARTAALLIAGARSSERTGAADPTRFRVRFGELELIAPPGALNGVSLHWSHGPRALGADEPSW